MIARQPPRDGEHFHDPDAMARLRQGALIRARHASNLRFALQNFPEHDLHLALAEAMTLAMGNSKSRAFNVLDAAMKEVAK